MDSQSNRAAIVAPPVWPAFFLFSQKTFMPSFLLFLGPRTVRQIILPRGPFPLQLRTPVTGLIGHRWPVHSSSTLSRTSNQNRGASGCHGDEHSGGYERSNGPAHCSRRHATLLRDGFLPHADFSGPLVHVYGEHHTYKLFRWRKFCLKKLTLERIGVHSCTGHSQNIRPTMAPMQPPTPERAVMMAMAVVLLPCRSPRSRAHVSAITEI